MITPLNPYQKLGKTKFWKTGVVNALQAPTLGGLWRPKFSIEKSDTIATVGSCFAQHISQWLRENDYQWKQAEPNTNNSELEHAFTFRVGNVYTAALFNQWVRLAWGLTEVTDDIALENGQYFDLLRPSIQENGFSSREALLESRQQTLDAMRQCLGNVDLLIFTLGLTEGWTSSSGTVYPMCPGTVRGTFDSQRHQFVNFSYRQIQEDLTQAFELIRSTNPNLSILLTVSPVALTATASPQHILVANTYSKSLLRTVAGELSQNHEWIDYFPSYELIASHPQRGRFFNPNMRTVKSEGVAYVMRHFGSGIGKGTLGSDPETSLPEPVTSQKTGAGDTADVCEEAVLESWAATRRKPSQSNLCLLGDSHMGKLSEAFTELQVDHCGGGIMRGSAWVNQWFALDEDELLVPLDGKASRQRWNETLPFLTDNTAWEGKDTTVISNLGIQSHLTVDRLIQQTIAPNAADFSEELLRNHFLEENKNQIKILQTLQQQQRRVIILTDPPSQFLNDRIRPIYEYWELYDLLVSKIYSEMGFAVINARTIVSGSEFETSYISRDDQGEIDWIHGNEDYYLRLASLIRDTFLKPQVSVPELAH